MKNSKLSLSSALIPLYLLVALPAHALKVITTTPSLSVMVEAIGQGQGVQTESLAKGSQDPHSIEAKPSFMVKLRTTDLVIAQGLELESAWIEPLVHGARNPRIQPGTKGFLELGAKLEPIEIPRADVTRAEGDVHPGGNPHFQMDPVRMGRAALIIAERMGELDGAHKDAFLVQAKKLQAQLDAKTTEWRARILKTGIKEVVTYHKTLSYFLDRFGIKSTLQLEPKPGIPPSASHLMAVIQDIKARKIPLVLIENYFDDSASAKLKQEVPGLRVVRVPVEVGGDVGIASTEQLIERIVQVFEGK